MLPHGTAGHRVEPDRGLVEEEHLGTVEHGLRDLQATDHAAGKRPDQPVAHVPQAHEVERVVDPLAALGTGYVVQPPEDVQVLIGGQ